MNILKNAQAFSPSHITGFFQIFEQGSTGAGLNTEQGAKTKVSLIASHDTSVLIKINNEAVTNAHVSSEVFEAYSEYLDKNSLIIEHEIMAPIGYGLGMSAAGSYSLSLALNELFDRPYDLQTVMEIAKLSEIKSGTGLGDVVAQQFAGVMMGEKPYPSTSVQTIEHGDASVVCGFFAPIDTKSIIRDQTWKDAINRIGGECMEELAKDTTLKKFIELSRHFSLETKLANDQILEVMNEIPTASMAMLGQTVFIVTNTPEEIEKQLRKFTLRISVSKIAAQGAHVIL